MDILKPHITGKSSENAKKQQHTEHQKNTETEILAISGSAFVTFSFTEWGNSPL